MTGPDRIVSVVRLGRRDYRDALALQRRLAEDRRSGRLDRDLLLLVEHPHVLTIGRGGGYEHLIADRGFLARRGVEVVEVERGGDITYHGPGQLVGYPILDLRGYRLDLHWYLRRLEEVCLRALAHWGLPGCRVQGRTGAWTGDADALEGASPGTEAGDGFPFVEADAAASFIREGRLRKVASIGVHASRWVTRHGFALNVTARPLESFGWIVPCGISGVKMTSLATEGADASLPAAERAVTSAFGAAFGVGVSEEGDLPFES